MLLSNEDIKEALWKNDKKSLFYKLERLCVILRFLGLNATLNFMKGNNNHGDKTENKLDINFNNQAKIVVYTSIFGSIDSILDPLYYSDSIDYRIITDQVVPENSKWKKICFPDLGEMDNRMKNRYCKMFPHIFFSEYETSIYIDGNILVVSDLSLLLSNFSDSKIGIFNHPMRSDIYDEAAAVIYLKNALAKDVKKQIEFYRSVGFPKDFGLFENSLIVRKHNDPMVIKVMESWWSQINTFTIRDQLSLMFVIWRLNVPEGFITTLGNDIDLCPLIRRIKHVNK